MRIRSFAFFVAVFLFGGGSYAEASKRILVDLTHQIAIAYQDGRVAFYGRISSGKPGRETPTGTFHVREKDVDHVSNLWPQPNGGARMPYMLRITRDGVAMHLGPTPDYPASHGCIRMQDGFAQRMFAWAQKWTMVDVVGKAPAHSPAVALPAYARSRKLLRRSIGGGTRGPLAAISTNPKDHIVDRGKLVLDPAAPSESPAKAKRPPKRRLGPLAAISANPKVRAPRRSAKRSPKTKQRAIRKPRPKHPRHADPLEAIGAGR